MVLEVGVLAIVVRGPDQFAHFKLSVSHRRSQAQLDSKLTERLGPIVCDPGSTRLLERDYDGERDCDRPDQE